MNLEILFAKIILVLLVPTQVGKWGGGGGAWENLTFITKVFGKSSNVLQRNKAPKPPSPNSLEALSSKCFSELVIFQEMGWFKNIM